MKRRNFLGVAVALPAMAAGPLDLKSIKSRGPKKVEIAYKSPQPTPNGLQTTKEGLWIVDETSGPTHWVSLVNFADGKVKVEIALGRGKRSYDKRAELAKRDAIVMHPGPYNRGMELDDSVLEFAGWRYARQVYHGVAVRMAVLDLLVNARAA